MRPVWWLALGCILALGAVTARADKARPAPVLRSGKAAAHGIKERDLDELRALLKKTVADGPLRGVSLLLAIRGDIVFHEGHGNLSADQPVRIASSTKPITAAMVLILVDQGKLSLADPVEKYLPEFKGVKVSGRAAKRGPTVRELLCHLSGISQTYPDGRNIQGSLADFVRKVAARPLSAEPGTTFAYGGVGMDVAARVCEVAGADPFEDLVRRHIWEPLGMKKASFTMAARPGSVKAGVGRYISAGGGMSAAPTDMAAFYQMLLNGGRYGDRTILSARALAEMQKKQSVNPRATGFGSEYGLGLYRAHVTKSGEALTLSHGGLFGTMPWLDRDRELVGVFFTQALLPRAVPVIRAVQEKVRRMVPATVGRAE